MQTSFSALDTFRSCPLKYKYQEIDKRKTPKSAEAVFGTLVHSTMKYIHEGGFLPPSQKDALQFFSSNWNPDVFADETQERMAFAQGIKIIQDYYQHHDPSAIQIVDLESRFTIELQDQQETHLISGFIDRIDKTESGYEILDYKTGRKLPSQDSVDENLQLLIYLLAFLKRYPEQRAHLDQIRLSLYFLKHGVKLSSTKTKQQLEQGKQSVLAIIHDIGQSTFPPNVTPLCGWCGYQPICPMWKHKFKSIDTPSDEEKQTIIARYVELQQTIKQHRTELAQLAQRILDIMQAEQADRLFTPGVIVARSHRQTFSYDEPALQAILSGAGLWDQVLKVDQTKLKKVLETVPPEMKKQIQATKTLSKETWTLSVKKDKQVELFEE